MDKKMETYRDNGMPLHGIVSLMGFRDLGFKG